MCAALREADVTRHRRSEYPTYLLLTMPKLPEPVNTYTIADAIVKWWDKQADEPRAHLGASEIGKPCDRSLWFSFRWATKKQFSGQMKRLLNTGVREEARFLEELRGIGAEVYDRDPVTNLQHRFTAVDGHFGGSCDGVARGLPEGPKSWAVVEFKTHSAKSFAELVKADVEQAKPEHYAQMQVYMGLAELDRALYLAVNKDDDTLYSEWIHFNKDEFARLMARAEKIIRADEPPPGISTDPAWYQCKSCDHRDVCHGEIAAAKSCRTCVHASPAPDALWQCEAQKRSLSVAEQRIGCRAHLLLPPLVTYAEALDAGPDYIKYQHKDDGTIFANCTEDADKSEENMGTDIVACLTSAELEHAPRSLVTDKFTMEIRKEFNARFVGGKTAGDV